MARLGGSNEGARGGASVKGDEILSKRLQRMPVRHRGIPPEGRYMKMSIDLVRGWSLSPEALQVYMLLLSHQGDGSFCESVNAVADRYGWTWRRAKKAVDELAGANLAVIAGGCWYVAVGEPFTDAERHRFGGSVKTAEGVLSKQQNQVLSKQHNEVLSKQQNIEEQEEEQEEEQLEHLRYVSNAGAREEPQPSIPDEKETDIWDRIEERSSQLHHELHTGMDEEPISESNAESYGYSDDDYSHYGDGYEYEECA